MHGKRGDSRADLLPTAFARRSCFRLRPTGSRPVPLTAFSATIVTAVIFRDCPRPGPLTLPDPAHLRLGPQGSRRLVLTIAPRTASARIMVLPSAISADHDVVLTGEWYPGG